MISPQVINLNSDSVMAFNGYDVIDNTTQLPIRESDISSLLVNITFHDLMSNSSFVIESVVMTWQTVNFWTINIDDLSNLVDLRKYVGKISPHPDEAANLRTFYIPEFVIDNNSFEDTVMRMPYEIVIDGMQAHFQWYDSIDDFGNLSLCKYRAPAYEGGTGTTYATDPSRVTHRGKMERYVPPPL